VTVGGKTYTIATSSAGRTLGGKGKRDAGFIGGAQPAVRSLERWLVAARAQPSVQPLERAPEQPVQRPPERKTYTPG